MPIVLRKASMLFAVFMGLTGLAGINMATAQTKAPQSTPETTQPDGLQ
jgi:hypothetical protein